MRPPGVLLLDGVPGVLVMVHTVIAAVRPVNGLVQVPEPGRMDVGIGIGQCGNLREQKAKAKAGGTAEKRHYQALKYSEIPIQPPHKNAVETRGGNRDYHETHKTHKNSALIANRKSRIVNRKFVHTSMLRLDRFLFVKHHADALNVFN